MNNPNSENPPSSPPPPQPGLDSRRRLRELLSVPERDRTDEQWDEIIELEIQLAPGNRALPSDQGGGHQPQGGAQKPQGQGQGQQRKNRTRNNNRRQRPGKPAGTPS
jgi:hypothetical protein